jgi:hypothetical protein
MLAKIAKFDWYQSTVAASDPQDCGLVDHLLKAWPLSDYTPGKNLNGYHRGAYIKRGDRVLCHICWGGQPGINLKTTSDESPVLAEALRTFRIPHAPTRVDSCVDWVEEGLFDSIAAHLIQFAQDNRLKISQQGDWVRGMGRTLYLGSPDSPVRLVLYEKGYEQGGGAPLDWVRLEARIRPKSAHRPMVANWDASDVFRSQWLPDALQALGWDDIHGRASLGTVWRKSDEERARAALMKQYGAILAKWAADSGGWDSFGPVLRDTCKQSAQVAI